jgi:DNA polymerase
MFQDLYERMKSEHPGKRIVPGIGAEDAEMMIVGEAPGESEDAQLMPFVGRGGRCLNDCLRQADIKREDVYITNVYKIRPPNNRTPTKEEVSAFAPYLIEEIRRVLPDVIVALGSTASRFFYPGYSDMSKDRKKIFRRRFDLWGNFPVDYFPRIQMTYHPGFVLRNPSFEKDLVADLLRVRLLLKDVPSDLKNEDMI